MEVCAVIRVEHEIVCDKDGLVFIPYNQIVGYAVFENGQRISPIMGSYAEAVNWMEEELERRNEANCGPMPGM